jgi:O-antigen/teichoic acid export membrane protein
MTDYKDVQKRSVNRRLGFLFKDSVIYGGAGAVAKLFSIFTVPILTRILSKEEFGAIDGIGIFAAIFTPIMVMGMDSAIARFFYETDDEKQKKQVVSQGLLIEMILTIIVCTFIYINAKPLLQLFLDSPFYAPYFRIVVISMLFSVIVMFSQNLLKWTLARNRYLLISLGSTVLTVALTIILVWVFKFGIAGVFLAHLISNILFTAVGIAFTKHLITIPKNFEFIAPLLKFGWPTMFVALASALVPSIDRYFISNYLNLGILGVYSVGIKISGLIQLPVLGFQTAWGPFAFAIYKEKDAGETYDKVFRYYTILLTLVALLIVVGAEPLVRVFVSAKYLESIPIVLPLVFGVLVDSLSWISGIGIGLSKKTVYKTVSYIVALATSLIAIRLLIKPFGLMGVVYGLLISKIALTITKTLFAYKLYPVRYRFKPVISIVVIGSIGALLFRYFNFLPWHLQLTAGLGICLIFSIVMWLLFIAPADKQTIIKRVNYVWNRRNH